MTKVMSKEAIRAIRKGIERGDSIADMELLGMPLRIVNILEDSEYEITTLAQLMARTKEELMTIGCMGDVSIRIILDILSRYHELEGAVQQEEESLKLRIRK